MMNRLNAGMRLIGFNERGDREKDDFYATPPEATHALLAVEQFYGSVYEPCCGQGHISNVLLNAGYQVESTDLVDRGFGTPRVDFLMETAMRDNIVTNPPYGKLALQFAAHANALARHKVAMLLKLQFLEGVERRAFFAHTPPATVYVFSNRQSLMKNGESFAGGMMALAWFVWDKAYTGPTVVRWL
jgi:hypothetical protein